jgi:DNA-directed RNA polymerase subunit beta'
MSLEGGEKITGETAAEDILDSGGEVIVRAGQEISDKISKKIRDEGITTVRLRKSHLVPYRGFLEVQPGQHVGAGDRLTEGPLDPQKVLDLQGVRGVQEYLVREIQAVYKTQGVDINDKHIEIICRQMLKKRKIKESGDTNFLPGQVVDKFEFEDENRRVRELDPPGTEATADWLLLGITEASLQTDSFLSAASFQKTTRVLTEAAVRGKRDNLVGLKENVIIGRLIPAGTGLPRYRDLEVGVEKEDGQFERLRTHSRPLTLQDVELNDEPDLPGDDREIAAVWAPGGLPEPSGNGSDEDAATTDSEDGLADLGDGLASLGLSLADPDAEDEDLEFPGTVDDEGEEEI